MKAKVRLWWMKLHAYFACFFLPLTLLYVVSGVLYLFDIKGGEKTHVEYPVFLAEGWPETEQKAKAITLSVLADKNHPPLPPDYFFEKGMHDWYGYKQEVLLKPLDTADKAELVVIEHDFIHQMLLIHKGFAGNLFWLLAIFLGVSITFSLVSGVVIALQMPQVKKMSVIQLCLGAGVLVFVFV